MRTPSRVRWPKSRVLCSECEGGDDLYARCDACAAWVEEIEVERAAQVALGSRPTQTAEG